MRRVWPLAVLVLVECSPMVGFEVRFSLPEGATLAADRLHVRGRSRCSTGGGFDPAKAVPEPPEPGLEESMAGEDAYQRGVFHPLRDDRDPAFAHAQLRGSRCEVALTAWYDTNGDRVVNAGDFVGRYPTSTIRTHRACSNVANHFGTLPLQPVP